jgi:membrane protein YdbS with pleckstrin-like domain
MGIRVVPNETVPASIYRVLLPHERRVITVRFHPAVLIKPVAWALAGLAVAGLLSVIPHLPGTFILVIWLLWLLLLIRLLYAIYVWLEDYFVVTSQRLLVAKGVLTKSVNMMPLTKVTDMRFERSPWGRLLALPRAALPRGVRADLQGHRRGRRLTTLRGRPITGFPPTPWRRWRNHARQPCPGRGPV